MICSAFFHRHGKQSKSRQFYSKLNGRSTTVLANRRKYGSPEKKADNPALGRSAAILAKLLHQSKNLAVNNVGTGIL